MAWPDKIGIGVACLIVAVALYGLVVLLNGLPPSAPKPKIGPVLELD